MTTSLRLEKENNRSHGLVESEKNGQYVTYRIANEEVSGFFSSLRVLAESQLAEIGRITEKFFPDHEGIEPVNREDLLDRVRKVTKTTEAGAGRERT